MEGQCGIIAYGICQTGCNAAAVSCYAAAGVTFGTMSAGLMAPIAVMGCNAGLSACMATLCVPALVTNPFYNKRARHPTTFRNLIVQYPNYITFLISNAAYSINRFDRNRTLDGHGVCGRRPPRIRCMPNWLQQGRGCLLWRSRIYVRDGHGRPEASCRECVAKI
ncbi:hypothetical protein SeMB42_g02996 [Synchytrium endobioticum]|uniref:Uncharacterized protein n=1 Tax=Synchytrium endobioticum TaxID=286115 RepID=A0A507DA49_9FUNG|nr:hypothetical protein SeMB42_g03000 [Synchytrium endobioticum]TPX48428.1 hypothetical protein SeMB42_g03004 [Synchytrium endobioticum]TPX48433.1 hypothetical protein SeMB42_g02996 [Synchytrium endobioticum]